MKRTNKKIMWIFALGQLGWSILSGIIANLLVNFYQPDPADTMFQHLFITQGSVFIGLTIIGIITAVGRIFDAVTDPFIASKSDNCKHKLGKRIPFLRYSALPFAAVTILVFCCPVNGQSIVNDIWLFVTLMLFYLCMTAYCTPYNALIPVIGREQHDRMAISTFISITYLLGTGIAFSGKMVWSALSTATGLDIVLSARIVLLVMAVIALICMWLPAFFIKEKDFEMPNQKELSENMFVSLNKTFKNKQFRIFVLSDILYWVGITIFNTGFIYYVENLLKLNNYMVLFIVMTLVSFLLYIPVSKLTLKIGKKKMVIAGFILFAVAFLFTVFAGLTPNIGISNEVYGYIIAILVGIPMSILGVVPQAIVADIAEADQKRSGENHDGMFFAARTFAFKIGQSIAMLVFTSLATIGTSVDNGVSTNNGLGYRISLAVSLVFALLGAVALFFYDEKSIMKQIKEDTYESKTHIH